MSNARWALVAAALGAAAVLAGDALAKKGGGGKPGGDPPNTTPPDVAYTKAGKGKNKDPLLWVMQDDGTGRTQITPGGVNGGYDWSPDGTQIAVSSNGFGSGLGSGIYVVDVDGTDLVRVADGSSSRVEWCSQPAPDGTQWLAITQYDPATDSDDFFLVSSDGSTRLNVSASLATGNGAVREEIRSWSPDGTQLLYRAYGVGETQGRLIGFSYDVDGDIVLPTTFTHLPRGGVSTLR